MSGKRKCAIFEDETQDGLCESSIDLVLTEFSTKKTSSAFIYAYGQHQDLRMMGEASRWKLLVRPLEIKEQGALKTNWIGCYLALESLSDVEAECHYTFRIQSPAGDSLMISPNATDTHGKQNGKDLSSRGYSYVFSHEDIEKAMLFDDKLHIHVDIRYKIISGGSAVRRSSPSAIFLNLLQKQRSIESGDILLISSDSKEFRVHKFILSMHSPVFAAMFEHPLKETATGSCVIKDLDGETISAMIDYMYGRDEWNPEMAKKLVVAANKYKIDPLEKVCAGALIEQLKVENVLESLCIADKHGLELLLGKSVDFIATNMTRVCAGGGLVRLLEIGKDLVNKIQERLTQLNDGKK